MLFHCFSQEALTTKIKGHLKRKCQSKEKNRQSELMVKAEKESVSGCDR